MAKISPTSATFMTMHAQAMTAATKTKCRVRSRRWAISVATTATSGAPTSRVTCTVVESRPQI